MFSKNRFRVRGAWPPTEASALAGIAVAMASVVFAVIPVAPSPAAGSPAAGSPVTGGSGAPADRGTSPVRVSPHELTFLVRAGQRGERVLTVTNSAGTELTWWAASGAGTARTRPDAPAPGAVLRSWLAPGVASAWGIGLEGRNVWVSDADLLRNERHTLDGVRWAGEGWPTDFVHDPMGPADMAYVPRLGLMCQVKVGEDNGIHCWNPDTGLTEKSINGDLPWTAASQRGLAYRPDDDTFYVGGWNDGIVYHIAGFSYPVPGTVIGQCAPADPAISGLGWSPGFDLLWMATSSADDTIYAIDPDTCQTLRTLAQPDSIPNTGGGLDVDRDGNLWLVSTGWPGIPPGQVYQIASGVPSFRDAAWLSVAPASGAVAPGQERPLTVRVDARGLAPGRYDATIYLLTGSADRPLITVPVRTVVVAPGAP